MQDTAILTKSRVGKLPVEIPTGVDVAINKNHIAVKGKLGELRLDVHHDVTIASEAKQIRFEPRIQTQKAKALTGTMRALVNNMVKGVSQGFSKELQLIGVGYRAQMQGKTLQLSLGYSHPVDYVPPAGIIIETPSLTEIVVKGSDRQVVGSVAADIRAKRGPEPYKGKGVRYKNEFIKLKETKKK